MAIRVNDDTNVFVEAIVYQIDQRFQRFLVKAIDNNGGSGQNSGALDCTATSSYEKKWVGLHPETSFGLIFKNLIRFRWAEAS